MMFDNRKQAGQLLLKKIKEELKEDEISNLVVLSIPRGGVEIGRVISQELKCDHDVILTKKISVPQKPELAIGATGETEGSKYINKGTVFDLGIKEDYIKKELNRLKKEIKRKEGYYRENREEVDLENKIVLIVDDGVATGATMIAACREVWNKEPKKVICASPVFSFEAFTQIEKEADAVLAIEVDKMFYSVSQYYKEFEQVSDEQVSKIMKG